MSSFITANQSTPFPTRTGYSPEETEKAYNKVQKADGGRAGSKMSTVDELKSYYSASLAPVHSHPDNDAVDWMEILVSCHHMHGYRLNGKPLGINSLPVDWHG